jgi:hypothetical protein
MVELLKMFILNGLASFWLEHLTLDQEEGHQFYSRQGQNLAICLNVEGPGVFFKIMKCLFP